MAGLDVLSSSQHRGADAFGVVQSGVVHAHGVAQWVCFEQGAATPA